MKSEVFDVVVVGGGIAGVSVAANLAETLKVVVLERESHPGLHSTGRSAALFSEIYGGEAVRALSRGSREFFLFATRRLRFGPHRTAALDPAHRDRGTAQPTRRLRESPGRGAAPCGGSTAPQARTLCPILRDGYIVSAALETASADLDVNGLHQGWLRKLRAHGGRLLVNAEVNTLEHTGAAWKVVTPEHTFQADVVINAAGAWADVLARRAGVREVGLQPRRRTALIVDVPPGMDIDAWPMVIDADEQFYFKPDAGALLLSPADETPSEPCDAWPDDWDVAVAVDRVQNATTLEVERVRRSWAGLRSFVSDREPVVGFAPDAPGFFWLAGQGGYGIQTAPAMSALAAALVRRMAVPAHLLQFGLDVRAVEPARF